jgi:predicted permease
MRGFLYDLRLGARSLLATRWSTAAAVLILALGTGVNTAVLALAYGILLRPLPYADPSRLVVIALQNEGGESGVPAAEVDEWRQRLRAVEHVAAYSGGEFTVRGLGEPRVVRAALVKGDLFQLLGVPPIQGRFPSADREDWVVVATPFAARALPGGGAVGRQVSVGQAAYTVASVMPPGFVFPWDEVGIWLPASSRTAIAFGERREARSFRLVARLGPGVSLEQAREDAARVLREIHPPSDANDPGAKRFELRPLVTPLGETLTGRVRPILSVLFAAAVIVLLVSCGNVASLFVGRAVMRRHHLAVRLAIGASRWRLVREILAESLLVAAAASLAGVWIGFALVRLVVGAAAGVLPRLQSVAVDLPVLAASAAVAFLVTLLCGAAPAMHAVKTDFAGAFRNQGATSSRPARRLRAVLVVSQIALAIVLLAGAGLVARTVVKLLEQASGYQPGRAVTARLVMSDTTTFSATSRIPLVRDLIQSVRRLPGVEAAGVGSALPPRVAPLMMGVRVKTEKTDEFQPITLASVTPGYLQAIGARLVRGRLFEDADLDLDRSVVLLSESAARHLAPKGDAVGRPLVFPLPQVVPGRNRKPEVVGIVGDIKYSGLDSRSLSTVYVLWADLPAGLGHLVVRAAGNPAALGPAVQRAVRAADPALPVPEIKTLDDEIMDSIRDRRLRLFPAVGFSVLALAVALLGLSASMSRAVSERRRELAIRGALGATPASTLRMVLREAALITAIGLVLGLGAAAALSRTLAQFVYGITPYDPVTFASVGALVALGATVVSYLAARRTLGIDPLELLREN